MEEKAIENIAYTVYGGEPFFILKKEMNLELTWNQLPQIRRVDCKLSRVRSFEIYQ